jgi:DNA ligase 1
MGVMVNSDQVYDKLVEIGAVSSRSAKEALLKVALEDEGFQNVVVAALDPFVTYGVADVPTPNQNGDKVFDGDTTWPLLYGLASRAYTGNDARNLIVVERSLLTFKSSALLAMIITKDLRAGFTEGTVNKVRPGTVRVFDCMLSHNFRDREKKVKYPVNVEPKLDGVRVLAIVNSDLGTVDFVSRTGKSFTTFDHLKEPLLNGLKPFYGNWSNGIVVDGEMVSGNFNETVSSARKKSGEALDAVFWCFDIMPLPHFSNGTFPIEQYRRRQLIEKGIEAINHPSFKVTPSHECHEANEVWALYNDYRANGYEGLIVKDPNAGYQCKRSAAWLKVKNEETAEAIIIDAFEGQGKYEGMLGGFIVAYTPTDLSNPTREGKQVSVGGGFSDAQRGELWNQWERRDGTLLGRWMEVEFHEQTPDGSLRHPRFVRFRPDKERAGILDGETLAS